MPVAPDPHPAFGSYAVPHRLVTTEWLSANIGVPGVRIIESNDDILLYDIGHVPGAVKIDWRGDLSDPVTRDYVDGPRFTELMRAKGIQREDTVVIYGDRGNAQAAHTAWIFTLFGHEDVRLLDGGRDAWISEERDTTFDLPVLAPSDYPLVARDDSRARAFRDDVLARLGAPLVDVRSAQEYSGELEDKPLDQEYAALRGGHIPSAVNIPWTAACGPDGRFRSRAELDAVYGALPAEDLVVYSRVGERSSHTWFVLAFLLGRRSVRNYDGSWIEWGNSVRLPIARGAEPGSHSGIN
ncbi:sulfurtransferase [Nocardia neocaledoniensis NBRC 108232]|uniref:Sulfurtransferase n=1 Tax=Nocardia neocaledoniensis TaxID=236511 RepID=A0A317NST0_9NOCA|nr:sulfurtransferase [Nocardia neocaledoniensis]PWV77484.1 thiosulfate/3-mercaptopyruvate sulfurtransferase [Nocardia neocaledoniensis]GEM33250.1 sulfurtransferase [Nocardia neocaledoniensis NBRC 108232]